jgi:GDP-6-deoxy-D-talose 4-dehydrogenase
LRIVVTGSAGFTGAHFVRQAAAAGHEPLGLEADLRDADAVARELKALRPEAVVHLAAISFVAHADERAFYDVNLFGTLNLVAALKRSDRLQKVLVASSANVYGNSEHSPLPESAPVAPVNHYAASKAAMEHLVRAQGAGLPLVITRPFNYTGVGQAPQFVIPKLVDHFRRKADVISLGNLDVEREYNDVRMICEAYLRLLAPEVPSATYNVCTGVTYDLQAVIGMLRTLTGHDLEVQVDPRFVRANEIRRLCGSPALLKQAIGALPSYPLEQTLSWMLAEGR